MKRPACILLLLAGVALGLLSAASMPLRYDHANSGRYLLPVLKAADSELFPSDPVVESLERFRSVFYRSLAGWASAADLEPADVELLFVGLYWSSRVLIVLSIMGLALSLDREPLPALALGIWACFTTSVPVGGESLFLNVVTHGTVAFLLGAWSLWAFLYDRRLVAWLLLAAALFVHPLMALHLLLCVAPAYYLLRRRIDRRDLVGGGVFLVSLGIAMAGAPPLSAEEAAIFLAAKGDMKHVALAAQGVAGWLQEILLLTLTLSVWRWHRRLEPSGPRDVLAAAVLCGVIAACGLSLIATTFQSTRLIQLQPLRAFAWIHLFSYLLLTSAAVQLWKARHAAAPPLTGFLALSLVPTLWQPLFAPLTLAALLAPRWRRTWQAATAGLGTATVLGWLARDLRPGLETLRTPIVPALMLLMAAGWLAAQSARPRLRFGLIALTLLAAAGLSAVSWHRHYDAKDDPAWGSTFDDRVHSDWDVVRRWVAGHTAKDERVVVAGGEGNFRTLALRTPVGESMSALAWVDPLLYRQLADDAARVAECREERRWSVPCLEQIAADENARYVLVEGAVRNAVSRPRFEVGDYNVFEVRRETGDGGHGAVIPADVP